MGTDPAVCDVVVLGGGPAGCAAAIHAAQRGLRVVLLEAQPFPRDRPGETLHPGVEPLLKQLGARDAVLAADFPRHLGNTIAWGGAPRFEAFGTDASGPWRGFQAWRATFDALLLSCTQQAGVEVRQPAVATALRREGERVTGVETADGTAIGARFVVDAAGGTHWLARQLGLEIVRHSPRLVARYGYAAGACPERDETPAIVTDERGWTWTARVRPGLYQWTRVAWQAEKLPRDWRPEELRALAPHGGARAADVTWRRVVAPAAPGYFIVGDAAAVLDPAASHGVLKGLMSGMMAAHLMAGAGGGVAAERRAAAAYAEWLEAWFTADVTKLRELYATIPAGRAWLEKKENPDVARSEPT